MVIDLTQQMQIEDLMRKVTQSRTIIADLMESGAIYDVDDCHNRARVYLAETEGIQRVLDKHDKWRTCSHDMVLDDEIRLMTDNIVTKILIKYRCARDCGYFKYEIPELLKEEVARD